MSTDYPYVYPCSSATARRLNETSLWRESHRENIACKNAIEKAIRRDFDGMHLKSGCAESVIEQYGFKRVRRVMANTVQRSQDGRFSKDNRAWAKSVYIEPDKNGSSDHNLEYAAGSPPAALDGFISQSRGAYQELGLFGPTNCESGKLDFKGKVLVLSPDILKESCWSQQNQLWLGTGGFGCAPNSSGRAVFATCLNDGEKARWNRTDFIGVLKEQFLPDWAREKLTEFQDQQSENMGSMKLE
ncbi:hypothetical protein A7X67_13245 [Clostridium sp. W14A]|nr:hypothetical protein A7X67_13245 [Clostridium sp. W14A]